MKDNRYQAMFQRLANKTQKAFVPFMTLGDPNLEVSEDIIDAFIAGGADALELGLPFSDPVADGPVIQAANLRALESGVKIKDCFALLARVRAKHPRIPIGLLVYCNLVHALGLEDFYQKCAEVGVDSVLIADLPLREAQPYQAAAKKQQVQSVFICPPDASESLIQQVAQHSEGYVYLVSRAGVTGTGESLPLPTQNLIQGLKKANSAPILLGFGISLPEHVAQAIAHGVDGAISGSAGVKIIEKHALQLDRSQQGEPQNNQQQALLQDIKSFAQAMKEATQIRSQ